MLSHRLVPAVVLHLKPISDADVSNVWHLPSVAVIGLDMTSHTHKVPSASLLRLLRWYWFSFQSCAAHMLRRIINTN